MSDDVTVHLDREQARWVTRQLKAVARRTERQRKPGFVPPPGRLNADSLKLVRVAVIISRFESALGETVEPGPHQPPPSEGDER